MKKLSYALCLMCAVSVFGCKSTAKARPTECSMGDPFEQPNFRPSAQMQQRFNQVQQTGSVAPAGGIDLGEAAELPDDFGSTFE